ncbi:hypothetical protein F4776DRAFT_634354, partial [Hypoxylon sp. NC0597]
MSTIDQPYGRYILTLIHIVLLATNLRYHAYSLYPNRRERAPGSLAKSALNAKGNRLSIVWRSASYCDLCLRLNDFIETLFTSTKIAKLNL